MVVQPKTGIATPKGNGDMMEVVLDTDGRVGRGSSLSSALQGHPRSRVTRGMNSVPPKVTGEKIP